MNPLDYSRLVLGAADLIFVAGLILMGVLSWAAGRSIRPDQRVPMQFGLTGKPLWTASRRTGLLFAPTLAAISGLFLTALAHLDPNPQSAAAIQLSLTRVIMALAFVMSHILHLSILLRWLKSQNEK